MSADRELDHLLKTLRRDPSSCALDGIEQRVWQRIAGREAQIQRSGVGLNFVLASVVAAFIWGIFSGGVTPAADSAAPALLVEEMDLLPGMGNFSP
jgi:hypothetical protein